MKLGVVAISGSAVDFGRLIKSDSERLLRLLGEAGIRLD